jgi:integration host factor subunit beta
VNKSELVHALSRELNFSIKKSLKIIDIILDAIAEKLVAGEKVDIRGFGTFNVRQYDSYMGRRPNTGEQVEVQPKKLPVFKVGKALKKAANTDKQ